MRPLLWLLLLAVPASAADMPSADALALKILDSEALYTVTGGLKPVSEGFWRGRFPAAQQTSDEVEAVRQTLAALPLGPDLEAGVYVFAAARDGQRSASAFVAHKPSLAALVLRRKDAFAPLGIAPDTPPRQVMERIDLGEPSARWRAYGLVFGYPEYAVEFFVAAGEKQAETKQFVAREFLHLPTFVSDEGRFVYAVPKGHTERDEDRALKATTAEIFTRYRAWRTVYLDRNQLAGTVLLRNWITPPRVPAEPVSVACPPARWRCPPSVLRPRPIHCRFR